MGLFIITLRTMHNITAHGFGAALAYPVAGFSLLGAEWLQIAVVCQVMIDDRLHGGGVIHQPSPGQQSGRPPFPLDNWVSNVRIAGLSECFYGLTVV